MFLRSEKLYYRDAQKPHLSSTPKHSRPGANDLLTARLDNLPDLPKHSVAARRMNDIPGHTGDNEVSKYANDQKYQVSDIGAAEISMAVGLDLLDVQLDHLGLDGSDDGPENI